MAATLHESHINYGHADPTSLHMCVKTQLTAISTCYCHVWATNKYALQMEYICHMCRYETNYVLLQLTVCRCILSSPWYTSTSHYWHMLLKKYACHIAYISHFTATVIYIYTPQYYTYKGNNKTNLCLPHYCCNTVTIVTLDKIESIQNVHISSMYIVTHLWSIGSSIMVCIGHTISIPPVYIC